MPYDGVSPELVDEPIYAGEGAALLGRARVGSGAWLGTRSVVRADGHYVEIGDNFRLGAHSTVHIAHDVHPTHIGDGVTVGVNSIIHACDIGHRCHIGRDVVILDGSRVGYDVAIADGAIVFPRSVLESGWLHAGQPAKPLRRLEANELEEMHMRSRALVDILEGPASPAPQIESSGHLFVAPTARLSGRVAAGADVGVWFGCELDAGSCQIRIGESTNIQDNTIVRCTTRPVLIGRETTVGHNAIMMDCEIGDRSLIGIGAHVAAGTTVEEDVLLAAGARTAVGQVLESGWLYVGAPARQHSHLDEVKRNIIALTWPTYSMYARKFAKSSRRIQQYSRAARCVGEKGGSIGTPVVEDRYTDR